VCAVKCEACGDELPATGRSDRRYCDARCRRRAFEERHAAAPELAPVVPLSEDEQHVQELLGRVLREERLIGLVAAGAKTNWRAPAWILERRYPERWGPVRPQEEPEPAPPIVRADDPFAEVDMLAARRRARRDDE
jgi:hypothetical protein